MKKEEQIYNPEQSYNEPGKSSTTANVSVSPSQSYEDRSYSES